MKKIVYSFLALAIAFTGVNMASADSITVPIAYHYQNAAGNISYTQIHIKNMSDTAVRVSVTFNGNQHNSTVGATNTTSASGTGQTSIIAPNATWTLMTKDSELWGSTASMKRNTVVIQTSATNNPLMSGSTMDDGAGPVSVAAIFVNIDSSANPSGFSFPAIYRIRNWTSVAADTIVGGSAERKNDTGVTPHDVFEQ